MLFSRQHSQLSIRSGLGHVRAFDCSLVVLPRQASRGVESVVGLMPAWKAPETDQRGLGAELRERCEQEVCVGMWAMMGANVGCVWQIQLQAAALCHSLWPYDPAGFRGRSSCVRPLRCGEPSVQELRLDSQVALHR
jgi:hypothetical protein